MNNNPTQEALGLLNKTGQQTAPIDVDAIARYLGIKVVSQPLEDTVSGVLVIKDHHAAIGVNQLHHDHRKRFSIAHEIGHFVLHRENSHIFVDGALTFHRDQNSSEGIDTQEIQANTFAAELLMPAHMLRTHLAQMDTSSYDQALVGKLASIFNVSEQAMTIRLYNLGLLSAPF